MTCFQSYLSKKFYETNKRLNNTNTFLLDISTPLINYLFNKNDDFEKVFKAACWNNRRFASEQLEQQFFEATNDFITDLYIASDFGDLPYHEQVAAPLREYCLSLLQLVDVATLQEKLHSTAADLYNDVNSIQKKLLDATIELASAEVLLLYWQDAVSDIMLQEALLLLRYEYMGSLIR